MPDYCAPKTQAMNDALSTTDPLGHRVILPPDLCIPIRAKGPDTLLGVIRRPALLIRMGKAEEKIELHYYHSVDWDLKLLISARRAKCGWKAYACTVNPDTDLLAHLLEIGERLI